MAEEHPRLDQILDNWSRYISQKGTNRLDYAKPRFWASGGSDFDGMCETVDLNQAIMVDNFIWESDERRDEFGRITKNEKNLNHLERAAICNRYINTVWSGNRDSIDSYYESARMKISAMLYRKDVPDV